MAYYWNDETSVTAGSSAEYGQMALVGSEFFQVFGVEPVLGRTFTPEEQKPGGGTSVIVSHSFWRTHFGGDERALGQTVRMLDKTFNVVGVLPQTFHFPEKTDIWLPISTFPGNRIALRSQLSSSRAPQAGCLSRTSPGAANLHRYAARTAISIQQQR